MNLKTVIDLYPLDADRAPAPPRLAPLAAFLEHFGPARGYAVETEIVDALSLHPGLRRLYALVLHTGRTPADAGLPAPALADQTLICRATLRDDQGRVVATATAAQRIQTAPDLAALETAARQQLWAALGFGADGWEAAERRDPPVPGRGRAPRADSPPPALAAPGGAPVAPAASPAVPAAAPPDAVEPATETAPPEREPLAPAAPGAAPPDDATALALLRRQLAHLAKTRGVEPPAVATKAEAQAAIKALLRP